MNNPQQTQQSNNTMTEADVNNIVVCLENMANPNEAIRNQATEFLEQGEKNPEFPFVLLRIFANVQNTYQHIHRLQAALCLKNYINIHWNRRSKCFEKKVQLNDNIRSTLTKQICEILTGWMGI